MMAAEIMMVFVCGEASLNGQNNTYYHLGLHLLWEKAEWSALSQIPLQI